MNKFHANSDVASKKECFQTMSLKNPSICEQIEAVIISGMTTRYLGYIKRHGDVCAELVNKRNKVNEKQIVESSLIEMVNVFHSFSVSVRS